MAENYSGTDADTRRRLCGLLRLVHCSRAYLDWVLPVLALDHHCHPDSEAGWLPITPDQAGWLSKYAGASGAMKKVLWEERMEGGGVPEGWLNDRPRRQCMPLAGLTFTYSISREELLQAFANLEKQQCSFICLDVDATTNGSIWAMGLEWYPKFQYVQGDARAGMFLSVLVPAVYELESGTVHCLNELRRPTELLQADLYVSEWGADAQQEDVQEVHSLASSEVLGFNSGLGNDIALSGAAAPPAPEEQQAGKQQAQAQADKKQEEQALRAREAAVAAQWAAYLKDGKLTGKVVVLPREDNPQQ
ncbi:hypothetical protein HXX76_003156 [Chlamydomonas incerta]|uniref:Uncharacterized protein n=1 Tax=Chlamydomonas incerta TaxID=51695 RepID=A0A835W6S3_CHLIN|nr:hypothetical protein HXX76_003156 [Chlamydomonas incerta]|eukprot:KAG2441535.1 hypothetical protein HXX76_003156 [Chlamydomonas incerta]